MPRSIAYVAAGIFTASALCSSAAQAQMAPQSCCRPQPRWYAGIAGGATYLQQTDISHTAPGFPSPDGQSYKIGYGFSAAVGYKIFSGVRTEIEVAFRSNNVKSDPGVTLTGTATQRSIAFMANGYIDFHNATSYTPYIGMGAGPAHVKNPRFYDMGGGVVTDSISGWTVAYQFMAGVNYLYMAGTTPFEVGLGYRYFTGQDLSTQLRNASGSFSVPNDSHNLEIAARMYF